MTFIDEAWEIARMVAEIDKQLLSVDAVTAFAKLAESGARQTAQRCAEICETEEVLVPIAEWETRQKASAATAIALGALIRSEFGLNK